MRHSLPFAVVLVWLTTLLPAPVRAWTAQEIRVMPPYCAGRYARNDNPAEYKRWEAQYGPDFLHTHHLCDGIGGLNNYYKAKTVMEKRRILDDALGGLNYMIQHARPDFKLMPEVYWYRSRVFHLMDRPGEAVGDLRKAAELDPKQARFYSQAAEHLDRLRQRDEALKLVSEGLRHLPGNTGLEALYTKLGGKLPYPQPYANQNGRADAASAASPETSSPEAGKDTPNAPRLAVFDLSRNVGAARHEPPIMGAGAYILVEVKEDLAAPNEVRFRIFSQIPQPAARIVRIGIDTGGFSYLFAKLEVKDAVLGKYWPLRYSGKTYTHAYWPGFSPDFMAEFTINPKEAKMYDPRSLPPGGSLTLVATLAPGRHFEDVVQAMKIGLSSPNGLRFGVIAHHLMGYRPDPTKTIMDDAGFVSGGLRQLTGFDEDKTSSAKAEDGKRPQADSVKGDTATANPEQVQQVQSDGSPSDAKPEIGIPSNPWCRFCPGE